MFLILFSYNDDVICTINRYNRNEFMYNDKLFIRFCEERNIKNSTMQGYVSTLKMYTKFNKLSLTELVEEAVFDEESKLPLKDRRLKSRLVSYRSFLIKNNMSSNTIKTYFSKVKTFYSHFEIEIPHVPDVKYNTEYVTNYKDLPTKNDIRSALDISPLYLKALILFMSSSGTAKAETLSLTVGDFITGCEDYYCGSNLKEILEELSLRNDVVPTIYLRRIKTDKYYYTFCSPEASKYIVKYLCSRRGLCLSDRLFPFSSSGIMSHFQEINDSLGWGFKGKYRFFRTHTLRKFHASNIQLSAEYVDALQGRSKNKVHETYIKTNPDRLKQLYIRHMHNVMIYDKPLVKDDVKEEINITINVFLSDNYINLI